MKKKLLLFAAFLLAVVSFTSCSKDEYNSSNIFTSDYEEYGVSKDQQTLKIDFKSSCKEELEIVNFSNWLNATIVKSNSSLYVTFSDNSGDYARTAEIIIQTKDEKHSKTIKIIQEGANGFCPDGNHPHAIDLGTGVKWACCNVGAHAPWETGGFYSWGEYQEKSEYQTTNYKYYKQEIGNDISGTQYDVAHLLWQQGWKMPTESQFDLLRNFSSEWYEMKGHKGRRFKNGNGIYIFIPAAGYKHEKTWQGNNQYAAYWTATRSDTPSVRALDFIFDDDQTHTGFGTGDPFAGRTVRPVTE